MKQSNTSQRLRQIMRERNLKQVDILEAAQPYCIQYEVKLSKSDLSQYVSGKVEPGQDKLFILGQALNVSEAWLMGFDVPREKNSGFTSDDPELVQAMWQLKKAQFITKELGPKDDLPAFVCQNADELQLLKVFRQLDGNRKNQLADFGNFLFAQQTPDQSS